MDIHVRRISAEDAPLVAHMVAGLLAELDPGFEPNITTLTGVTRQVLSLQATSGVLAIDGAEPVGVLMLNECAAIYAGGRFGEITELYVRADLRSQGLAGQLMEEARAIARERGWKRLEVGAPGQPKWERTKSFYERQGFTEVGPRMRLLV